MLKKKKGLRVCFTRTECLLAAAGTWNVSVAPELVQAPVVPAWPEWKLLTHVGAEMLLQRHREAI